MRVTETGALDAAAWQPQDLAAAIAEAEGRIARWERAILDAATPEAEEAARDELTRAELELDALLDARNECGSCEGWPRGK